MSIPAFRPAAGIAAARPRILAVLAESPGLSAGELAAAVGADRRKVTDLLRRMHNAGLVVAHELGARPRAGRPARIWFAAPAGTPRRPGTETAAAALARRERARVRQQQRRARAAASRLVYVPAPLPVWQAGTGPACTSANPGLFFGPELEGPQARAQRTAAAKAVCAGCPARTACLDGALTRAERWGVWGGFDLETERPQASR